jgi:hypothetical protein
MFGLRGKENTNKQHKEREWDNADSEVPLNTEVVAQEHESTKLNLSGFAPCVLAHFTQQQQPTAYVQGFSRKQELMMSIYKYLCSLLLCKRHDPQQRT